MKTYWDNYMESRIRKFDPSKYEHIPHKLKGCEMCTRDCPWAIYENEMIKAIYCKYYK
jgi:hypothetical protein